MDKKLALETLKSFVENTDNVIAKDAVLTLHPELAESDDERIRQGLLFFIKKEREKKHLTWDDIPLDVYEAYLEKQKEPENVSATTMIPSCWTEKQKEQELIEWSDYDIELLNIITSDVKRIQRSCGIGTDEWNIRSKAIQLLESLYLQLKQGWNDDSVHTRFAFYTYKDEPEVLYFSNVFVEESSRNNGLGTLILKAAEKVAETISAKSIRLKVKRDSPVKAWYRKHGYNYIAFEDEYDWLEKTLEYLKSSNQEWSEEDEKWINYFYSLLGMAYQKDMHGLGEKAIDAKMWLKSRLSMKKVYGGPWGSFTEKKDAAEDYAIQTARYPVKESEYLADLEDAFISGVEWKEKTNWKPSEEQMTALYTAAHEAPIIKENGNYLYDLYDELKKL